MLNITIATISNVKFIYLHSFFLLPLCPPLTPPLVLFAPRPRRLLSNTDRAVTMATSTPPSLSSPELLLLLTAGGSVLVDKGAAFAESDSWLVLLTSLRDLRGDSTVTSDPRNPPPATEFLSSLSPPSFFGLLLAAFPLLDLDGEHISSSLSSSSSSPPSLSFLFKQVTALRSRWLRIVCFSCCSMRKNESILS